jgi:hypothetical protein
MEKKDKYRRKRLGWWCRPVVLLILSGCGIETGASPIIPYEQQEVIAKQNAADFVYRGEKERYNRQVSWLQKACKNQFNSACVSLQRRFGMSWNHPSRS